MDVASSGSGISTSTGSVASRGLNAAEAWAITGVFRGVSSVLHWPICAPNRAEMLSAVPCRIPLELRRRVRRA